MPWHLGKQACLRLQTALDSGSSGGDFVQVCNTKLYAGMAELADALDSGSSGGDFVQVQVLLPAPKFKTGGLSPVLNFNEAIYTQNLSNPQGLDCFALRFFEFNYTLAQSYVHKSCHT